MTRFFYIVFFSFLMLGIACIVAAFFVNSMPDPFQKLTESPVEIQSAEVKEIPLEEKIDKAANNPLRIVRICQGEVVRPITATQEKPKEIVSEEKPVLAAASESEPAPASETVAENTLQFQQAQTFMPEDQEDPVPAAEAPRVQVTGSIIGAKTEKTNDDLAVPFETLESPESTTSESAATATSAPTPIKRTYIFLASEEGVPEIITAKIIRPNQAVPEVSTVSIADANQPLFAAQGLRAEHGTLRQLKELDYARQQSRYSDLLHEAKTLCFNPTEFSEHQQEERLDQLKTSSTAFIQLDLDLDAADAKILIFYQVNGFIHQQEALLSDRKI